MAVEFCHGCGETHIRCSMLANFMFCLPIFTGVVVIDIRESYLLRRWKSVEYSGRYGCGHLRVAHECIGRIKNLMLRLIKIRQCSNLDLFRKVLRDTSNRVRKTGVCCRYKIYYDLFV